jgi:Histidine kinase-, DNA gyrase B-, and HSP90-like ATPase
VIQRLARDMATSMPVTVASVAMCDHLGQTLTVKAISTARSLKEPLAVGASLPLSRAPWHRAVLESKTAMLVGHESSPDVFTSDEVRSALIPGLRAVYLVPIRFNGEVAGVLTLGEMRSVEREPFDELKLQRCHALLEEFTYTAAPSWEAHRLRQQVGAMSSLMRMVQGVLDSHSYQDVLACLATEVSGWFGTPVRAVLLGNVPAGGMDIIARWNAPPGELETDGTQFLAALSRSAEGPGWPISVVPVADDPLDPLYERVQAGETWTRICLAVIDHDRLVGLACLYVEDYIRLTDWERDALRRRAEIVAVGMGRVSALEEHRGEQEWLGRAAWELLTTHQHAVLQQTLAGVVGFVAARLSPRLERVLVDLLGRGDGLRDGADPELVRPLVEEVTTLLQELRDTVASPVASAIRPVEVNGLVRRAVEIARIKWQEGSLQHGAPVELRFEPAAEPLLVETSIALVGPLVNAIEHAAEAIPGGGRIHVRTGRDNGYVVISVEDNGVGVPAHLQDEPFAPTLSAPGPPHLRLGLSVFHAFAAQHGGEARLASGELGGTALTLRLPATRKARTERSSDV